MFEERQMRRDGGSDSDRLTEVSSREADGAGTEVHPVDSEHPGEAEENHALKHETLVEAREAFKSVRGNKIDLFVYGTLVNEQHVKLLLNRKVENVPATLNNYMRVVPPGAFYFIVKQHGASTHGRLLKQVTLDELARIDAFEDEGNLYFRRVVVVRLEDGTRRRCMTYVGNISALQKSFGKEIMFEDRYSLYLERKIDKILERIEPDRHEITRRALRELMGSEVDSLIESHFDGNYICNYIMIQSLSDAKPPLLVNLLSNPDLLPYADNYIKLACQHIIFNQFAELIRHQFPDTVRLTKKYFRHGLSVLLAFLYYNRHKQKIEQLMKQKSLDRIVPGRLYRDYAVMCIHLVEEVYVKEEMLELIRSVDANWYSTPTPLGAELEFSFLGAKAVSAQPGDDPVFDGFYWFQDFDLQRRTWRLGGHVDSHRNVQPGSNRHRGFLEYALGRFNIVEDLSRPLFDCPWAMSRLINEAVKFLNVPPHSLHISMDMSGVGSSSVTDQPHKESDLACLLLLGGDIRRDETGKLREWRIYNHELDTNLQNSLNFSDRKQHYSRPDHQAQDASDVMEYKYLRLRKEETDYCSLIVALKCYQFESRARPLSIRPRGEPELPEQIFLREWATHPQAVSAAEIQSFVDTVERGMMVEHNCRTLDRRRRSALEAIHGMLTERNKILEQK